MRLTRAGLAAQVPQREPSECRCDSCGQESAASVTVTELEMAIASVRAGQVGDHACVALLRWTLGKNLLLNRLLEPIESTAVHSEGGSGHEGGII